MPIRSRTLVIAALFLFGGLAASVRAEDPVLLKYKVAQGQTQYSKTTQDMKQTQSLLNMKLESTVKQEAILSRVVDKIDAAGQVTFKTKAESRKAMSDLGPAGKFEFDSKSTTRDTSSQVGAALTPIMERLTGSEYEVVVSPRGQVVEVKGYAEMIADLLKDNPLAAQFGGGDNRAVALNEQDSFVIFSDKPVKTGDTWEVPFDLEIPNLGKMRGKTVFTHEGADKVGDRKTIRIGITSETTFDLALDQPGVKVSGTLTTNGFTGTAQFDPEAGQIVSMKREFGLAGQLSADAGGMTIAIDTQQQHTSTSELLDKLP